MDTVVFSDTVAEVNCFGQRVSKWQRWGWEKDELGHLDIYQVLNVKCFVLKPLESS